MVSFERRTVVSARKLEELGARGKKELADRPQIDVRPFSVAGSDEPRQKLAQAPLTLALSDDRQGTLGGFPHPPATTPLGEAELRQRASNDGG